MASDAPSETPTSAAPPADVDQDEETISFIVKSIADTKIPMTVSPFLSVADLKQKLAEPSTIPADRQRLIYSGRVLKDDQTINSYKIQNGHTVHLVKGAASTASAARGNVGGATASSTGPASTAGSGNTGTPGVPPLPSMAAGTGMNPLSRLTNHIPLPSAEMFGPDGGMGPPPDPDQMLRMMESPEVQQGMSALLSNPAMLDSLIQSNPMLQAMGPEARRMMQSEEFRRMMTDPAVFRQMTQMQRMMGMGPFAGGAGGGMFGGGAGSSSFPAPGVTDQTPVDSRGTDNAGNAPAGGLNANPSPFQGLPPQNPFASLFNPGNTTTPLQSPPPPSAGAAGQNMPNPFAFLNPALFGGAPGAVPAGQNPSTTQIPGSDTSTTGQQPPQNPFQNPFMPQNMDLNQLQNMMQLLGMAPGSNAGAFGGFGNTQSPPAPADNRPPEERYADQLRQLNDMGFTDFESNVTALRRSGGSVQGAVEYLLSN